jgi:hypothetical protein
VAVIGEIVARFLFEDADPLGAWIQINAIQYRVVGVFQDEGGEAELRKIYIPISTAQMAYGGGDRIHQLMFTVDEAHVGDSKRMEAEVRAFLAARHDFSPDDRRALRIRNNLESFQTIMAVFQGIQIFVWIIGGFTVIAGIVGVSNIMLISVKRSMTDLLAALAPRRVGVIMPRFSFGFDADMKQTLRALGMQRAFQAGVADLSGISATADLEISDVAHQAFIAVDEQGTEAAAATGVVVIERSRPPYVVLDRPFLFLIRDRVTGSILFLGRVVDPSRGAS